MIYINYIFNLCIINYLNELIYNVFGEGGSDRPTSYEIILKIMKKYPLIYQNQTYHTFSM